MSSCDNFDCPYRTLYGNCSVTACINHEQEKVVKYNSNNMVIFPQTIGDITFYSKKELFEWVITQQKMNKDPDYGRGIYS